MCSRRLLCGLVFTIAVSTSWCELDVSAIGDGIIPRMSSSPGWRDTPHDVSVLIGALVKFDCHTFLYHTEVSWNMGGQVATNHPKLSMSRDNTSVTYGPVEVGDDGLVIGCEIQSLHGNLPSPTGTISIHSRPIYNPPKIQVAYVSEPFVFDFNYTAPFSPFFYSWCKNGNSFQGDGARITIDHTGIVFTNVKPEDAGQYSIKAGVQGEVVTIYSYLNVNFFKQGKYVQSVSSSAPIKSSRLAVLMALADSSSSSSSNGYGTNQSDHSISRYAQLFRQFKKPSNSSRSSGNARVETERFLLAIANLTGNSTTDLDLSARQMDMIAKHVKCVTEIRRPRCTLQDLHFRSADGTCNNFFYPLNGAAETPFARILPANYEDGISTPVGLAQQNAGDSYSPPWPSARHISWKIIEDIRPDVPPIITHMVMQWGQFVDHDLDIAPVFDEGSCGCTITPKCIPIEVNPLDPVFGRNSSNNGSCLPFSRSVPSCARSIAREQVNDLTSYIDASNVYGSSLELANSLRLFKGGLLKQGNRQKTLKGNLPFQEESTDFSSLPFFFAGDERSNEQLGLTIMHTIWMREHNRIARALMRLNPCWSDERLYQETRKIVGAMQQVISYKEFLPIVLGPNYNRYIPRYRGYNPFVDASVPSSFAGAAYRFGHSLVRNQLDRLDRDYEPLDIGPLPLDQAFFNPIRYFESLGTDPILRGLTVARSNPVDEFLNFVLTSKLFVEPGKDLGFDLASLNIQRGRDHGLPPYRKWERFCKRLFPGIPVSFQASDAKKKLTAIYGADGYANGMDLWLGGLAEKVLPGGIIGPTFGCIFGITFSRLRDGDRFWYQNPYVFTPRQRVELERVTLAKVICDNADDIPSIQRSVFLGNRPRVSCHSIPSINLAHWWDRRCYYRRRRSLQS